MSVDDASRLHVARLKSLKQAKLETSLEHALKVRIGERHQSQALSWQFLSLRLGYPTKSSIGYAIAVRLMIAELYFAATTPAFRPVRCTILSFSRSSIFLTWSRACFAQGPLASSFRYIVQCFRARRRSVLRSYASARL